MNLGVQELRKPLLGQTGERQFLKEMITPAKNVVREVAS